MPLDSTATELLANQFLSIRRTYKNELTQHQKDTLDRIEDTVRQLHLVSNNGNGYGQSY